jgi:hypothetical protein
MAGETTLSRPIDVSEFVFRIVWGGCSSFKRKFAWSNISMRRSFGSVPVEM